jgi:hypothetical protein
MAMQDNKLIDDARALTAVIASGSVELSYEQVRGAFLRIVPTLITEIEILDGIRELRLEMKPKRRRKKS